MAFKKYYKTGVRVLQLFLIDTIFTFCDSTSSGFEDRGQLIELDVRVFLLESSKSENITAKLNSVEIEELFEEVNEVWSQANIQWNITLISTEEAQNAELFELMMNNEFPRSMALLRSIIPRDKLTSDTWDVFLIHDFGGGIGGVYFPDLAAVLQPEVDPLGGIALEGGLVRILAHELGHSLGLPHVPCTLTGNLMAPGCFQGNQARISETQIENTRKQAASNRPFNGNN